jgi:protein involved in ribonucleotide reduction
MSALVRGATFATLALLLASASSQAQEIRVGTPPAASADILTMPGQCTSFIANVFKRNRCLACINRGGRFNSVGAGFCIERPGPVAAPDRAVQRTNAECSAFVHEPHKRRSCYACVAGGGTYYKHANGNLGNCVTPPPPVADRAVQRTNAECLAYIHNPHKRQRCLACVGGGGTYFKHGAGGIGNCVMPAAPPPPAYSVLRSIHECRMNVAHPGLRHRCVSCVSGGGSYRTDGTCLAAPMPAPGVFITTVPDCFSRIAFAEQRHQCRRCVQRGLRWDVRGFCR